MLQGLLSHPITPIIALTVALAGMGSVAPEHNAQTSVNAYTLYTPPTITTSTSTLPTATHIIITTPAAPARVPSPAIIPAATSSRHYSVPASLRGESGEGGGEGSYDD